MHKLREAMKAETRDVRLDGEVEVDGAVFGGHVRPANLREERVDRRRRANRSGKRRVVVVLRQRGDRTVTRTFLREAQGVEFARERIALDTVVSADEVAHWVFWKLTLTCKGSIIQRVTASEELIPTLPRASSRGLDG